MVISTEIKCSQDNKIPLKYVSVVGNMTDSFGEICVVQTYQNTYDKPIEAKYVFSLNSGSVITSFKMTIGTRNVIGIIQEEKKAETDYTVAKDSGKHAGLLKTIDPNIYCVLIGNILPTEQITITFTYLAELPTNVNGFKYVLPTNIAPVYVPTTDVSTKLPSVLKHTANVDYEFSIQITWRTCKKFICVTSPTNELTFLEDTEVRKCIRSNTKPSNTDFIVYAKIDAQTVLYNFSDDEKYVLMSHQIPDIEVDVAPKNYQFILDRSGSMAGNKMVQALDALELFVLSLTSGSFFNVISFGASYNALWQHSVPVRNETVTKCLSEIKKFTADMSGTNIYSCLNDALCNSLVKYSNNTPQLDAVLALEKVIILLTDGEVSNTESIVEMVKKNNLASQKCRIFGLGLGQYASKSLIEQVSYETNGTYKMIMDENQVSDAVIYLLNCVSKQYYKNVVLRIGDNVTSEKIMYPNHYFSTCCKLTNAQYDLFMSNGALLEYTDTKTNDTISHVIKADHISPSTINLRTLWAYKRINTLLESSPRKNKNEIIALSVSNQIMNELTAFVIVDNDSVTTDVSVPIIVPQYNSKCLIPPSAKPACDSDDDMFNDSDDSAGAACKAASQAAAHLTLAKYVAQTKTHNSSVVAPNSHTDQSVASYLFDPTASIAYKNVDGSFTYDGTNFSLVGYKTHDMLAHVAKNLALPPDLLFNLALYKKFVQLNDAKYAIIVSNLRKWLLLYINVDTMIKLVY